MPRKNKNENEYDNDIVCFSRSKYELMKKIMNNIHDNLGKVIEVFEQEAEQAGNELADIQDSLSAVNSDMEVMGDERILEGVFDGEEMIANDGQKFSIPQNYASKSKLVEGDILKLTIKKNGDFIYKQIDPVERSRINGELLQDANGNWFVKAEKKKWRVLPASVTYFKGSAGDEVIILVPKDASSKWGAVENIIKK